MKNTLLIVGSSGIGKTTLCRQYCDYNLNTKHITASSHVKSPKGYKRIDQREITTSIRNQVDSDDYNNYLIDGHLVMGSDRVPLDAISILNLDAIVFLHTDPKTIQKRRSSDVQRERPFEDANSIKNNQQIEFDYTKHVALNKDLPLHIIYEPDFHSFKLTIDNIIESDSK